MERYHHCCCSGSCYSSQASSFGMMGARAFIEFICEVNNYPSSVADRIPKYYINDGTHIYTIKKLLDDGISKFDEKFDDVERYIFHTIYAKIEKMYVESKH